MASRFGRRIRKGAAGTAVAAAAMAALTASQAPGLAAGASHQVPPGPEIDGGSPYFTQLPPLGAPQTGGQGGSSGSGSGTTVAPAGGAGIPAVVLAAYRRAEATLSRTQPDCHLPWQLLAAIGQVESGQAERGDVTPAGTTVHRILGPVLDGNGFADIPDTDNGRWDGDPVHDRAVGPMQFIPSTWAKWQADGNGDGVKDPNNVFDAALAAGDYLCAAGGDLAVPADMRRAILGYNHSDAYLRTVESWYEYFLKGVHEIPGDASGTGILAPGGAGTPGPSGSPTPHPSAKPSHSPLPVVSVTGTISPVSGSPSPTGGSPTGCPTPTTPGTPTGTTSPPATGPGSTASPTPSDPCGSTPPTQPPPPTSSSPAPTPSDTSAPATSAPATSAPATSAPATSAPAFTPSDSSSAAS